MNNIWQSYFVITIWDLCVFKMYAVICRRRWHFTSFSRLFTCKQYFIRNKRKNYTRHKYCCHIHRKYTHARILAYMYCVLGWTLENSTVEFFLQEYVTHIMLLSEMFWRQRINFEFSHWKWLIIKYLISFKVLYLQWIQREVEFRFTSTNKYS